MTTWGRPTPAPPPTRREYLLNAGIPLAIAAVAAAGLFVADDPPFTGEGGAAPRRECARNPTEIDGGSGLAVDDAGVVYVAQSFLSERGCVVRIDKGRVEVLARPGDEADLQLPGGMAVDDTGGLLVGDARGGRVVRIARDGRTDVVYRTGERGGRSVDVVGLAGGNLYLAESFGGRILKREPSGRVVLLAGDGFDKPVEGAPARTARFSFAIDIAVGPGGTVYVADGYYQVWAIDPDGRARLVAGTGQRGFSGDGGPARAAKLGRPGGVAADEVGTVYISDSENYRVRRVDRGGTITTIAGTGAPGLQVTGDGVPALEAQLSPGDLVAHRGLLYVLDRYGRRVRVIDPAGILRSVR